MGTAQSGQDASAAPRERDKQDEAVRRRSSYALAFPEEARVAPTHGQFDGVPMPPRPGEGSSWPGAFSYPRIPQGFSPYPDGCPGARRGNQRGVGAAGHLQVLPVLPEPFPENSFFRPGKALPCVLRYSNMSTADDAGMDIRCLSLRFADVGERSPLDLLMSTGERCPWWSSSSLSTFAAAHLAGAEAMREFLRARPRSFAAYCGALRRAPSSFSALYYYSHSAYELVDDHGALHHVRFRVIPSGEWCATHASVNPPDEGLPPADAAAPWFPGRLRGQVVPPDYLEKDLRKRLRLRPLIHLLQAHVVSNVEELDDVHLNPTTYEAPEGEWCTVGEVVVQDCLPQGAADVFFTVAHHPACLRPPPCASPHDFNSLLALRSHCFPPVTDLPIPRYEGLHGGLVQYLVRVSVGESRGGGRSVENNASVDVVLVGQQEGQECFTKPMRLAHWADNTFRHLSIDEWIVHSPILLDEISILSLKLTPLSPDLDSYAQWFVKRVELIDQQGISSAWKPGMRVVLASPPEMKEAFAGAGLEMQETHSRCCGEEAVVLEIADSLHDGAGGGGRYVPASQLAGPATRSALVELREGLRCRLPVACLKAVVVTLQEEVSEEDGDDVEPSEGTEAPPEKHEDNPPPEHPLGTEWEFGRLVSVVAGSAADYAGLEFFIGRKLTHVNGVEVVHSDAPNRGRRKHSTSSDGGLLLRPGTPEALLEQVSSEHRRLVAEGYRGTSHAVLRFENEDGPLVFPVYRWLEEGELLLFEGSPMLPHKEHDTAACKLRDTQLVERGKVYRWKDYGLLPSGLDATLSTLPVGERSRLASDMDLRKLFVRKSKDLLLSEIIEEGRDHPFESLEQFNDLFFTVQSFAQTPLPMRQDVWMDDVEYARHFLDGSLCFALKRFTAELAAEHPTFCLREHHISPFLPSSLSSLQDPVKELADRGILFYADFTVLDGLPCISGRYVAAPVILFLYTDFGGGAGDNVQLLPVAVQLSPSDSMIWTPANCTAAEWIIIKTWVLSAAAHVQFFCHRVLNLYFCMEPFIVSTKRNLPDSHPIYKLLHPHTKRSLAAIVQVRDQLIGEGGLATEVFALTSEGQTMLMERAFKEWSLEECSNFVENIARRGMDALPAYTFRDVACQLWDVIESYIINMLQRLYAEDEDVEQDYELAKWWKEIVTALKKPAMLSKGFNRKELTNILTSFVFTVSVMQAATTHSLWDSFACVPYSPLAMNAPWPRESVSQLSDAEIDRKMMQMLPNKARSAKQVVLMWMLATFSFTDLASAYQNCDVLRQPQERNGGILPLGHWNEDLLVHDELKQIVTMFQMDLSSAGNLINAKNEELMFPYVYLTPATIPNSITPAPARRVLG